MKAEQEKIGISVAFLYDENYRHNAIFYATLIKDEAVSLKMVEYLLTQGVDPTVNDTLNQTALFYASREGKPSLLETLVARGCNPNHVDTYQQTPIFYGAREGHIEVCKKLVQYGADPDFEDKNG